MANRRIFISHSANRDTASRPLLDDLEARLNALPDIEVLLDHSTVEAGEDWRSSINVWCGLCDAAILLVTPHSLTAPFCIYEWSILSYRKAVSKDFNILVVYAGTTPNDLQGKPQNLAEIQGVDVTQMATVWPRIQQWLATVVPVDGPTLQQARLIAGVLSARIGNANGPQVTQARKLADLPLGKWQPLQDPWEHFALQLIGLGLQKAMPALLELRQEFNEHPRDWYDVLDLVSSSWVDDRSSERLAQLSREGCANQAVAVNAVNGGTGRLYVIKASGRRPSGAWSMALATDSVGDLKSLKTNVAHSLRQALLLAPDADSAALERRLKVKRTNKQPVVVYLGTACLDSKWLAELRVTFDYVTFFLLAGSESTAVDGVEWLQPALPADFEEKFWSYYDDNKIEFGIP